MDASSPTGRRASCSPEAGTSPPRPPASSAAPAARCCPSRAPSCWMRARDVGGAADEERAALPFGQVRSPQPPRRRRDRPGGGAMSWPLASFTIVGLVLAAGWLAYERRRPSARMVAVVATLAAVAALGRDAFVALPDVKPITAIAFVVGYALGPLPGFTRRRDRNARVERHARPGPLHPVADGRLGPRRPRRRRARTAELAGACRACRSRSRAPRRR